MIRKLPNYERLPDRYGCVAIEDVNDHATLATRLTAILADSEPLAAMGARGFRFARAVPEQSRFVQRLEHVLETARARAATADDARGC